MTEPSGAVTEVPASHEPAQHDDPDNALARYQRRMRRDRSVYYGVLAVIVITIATLVAVGWSHSEVAHVTLHTVPSAPPSVGIDVPSQTLTQAWRTPDRASVGSPRWAGTVVTSSTHTVDGRDATTGKVTWSYTRTDRAVCDAVQAGATTVAVYKNASGNCDELSALDAGTGQRRWARTLDMDGQPIDGRPRYQITASTLLIYSSTVIYAIDPGTGYNRWTYQRYGCSINTVVLGTAGALISQTCSAKVRCNNVKLCGTGQQLLLRDGTAGRGDNAKPDADQLKWNKFGDDGVPVSADQVVSAVDPGSRVLRILNQATGATQHRVVLRVFATGQRIAASVSTTFEVVWLDGWNYAISPSSPKPVWIHSSFVPPNIVSTTGEDPPALATARIVVPTAVGVALLDGNNGRVIHRYPLPSAPSDGDSVFSVGSGFLVAGPSGVVAYR